MKNKDTNVPIYQSANVEGKQVHIRLPKDLYTKLKVRCAYDGVSLRDYIVRLIEESMGQHLSDGGSLLIVEDETIVRESLRDSLNETHVVTTATTGEEALDLIQKQDFDIMIVDVRLSGMSGLEVVKEVYKLKPFIKSIVITAYPSVELAVEAMKQGAVDYLIKPVSADDLERVIWKTLKSTGDKEVTRKPPPTK